jgi:hypothetical protein
MPKVAATRGADGRMRRTYYAVKTGDRESPPPPVNTAPGQATTAQPQVNIGISDVERKQKQARKGSPGELKRLTEEFCRRHLDRQTVLDMIDHLADFFGNADDMIDKLVGRLSPGEVSALRRELDNLVSDDDQPAMPPWCKPGPLKARAALLLQAGDRSCRGGRAAQVRRYQPSRPIRG